VAARLGGDEFGIVLDDLTDESQAELVAQRLLLALAAPVASGGSELRIQASVGIAFSGAEHMTAEKLINSADTAMYAAKERGKGQAVRFAPEMRAAELDRLELEGALRDAVREGAITVHYQPIVDLHSGAITGFEALARWTHPTLGPVRPDIFIPVAERIGLIADLGMHILDLAHAGACELVANAGHPLTLAVNLSALQVTDPALAERVGQLTAAEPDVHLVLELTEGMLLGDDIATLEALHRLKANGAELAIDDFGVGYSSVGYLHRLPVDILKIDKLFVSELNDPRSRALVQGVVAIAQAMNLTVVVEGVEDWQSGASVRDLECHLAQGYVFSRPVDLDHALELATDGGIDVSAMAGSGVPAPVS
jgi:predicted signal transduction protein with EAL and GGDEF domain